MKQRPPALRPPALRPPALRPAALAGALCVAAVLSGCPAVYPELTTRMRKVLTDQALDPPPPDNMAWIKFESARVPERTRGGKTWDEAFGKKPDPYAKLFINGKEVLRTPAESNTLEPTWPDGPKGNFRIEAGDKLRVELWDSNSITDKPIGVKELGHPSDDQKSAGRIRVDFDAGGEIVIAYEKPRAMLGLGLWYELRSESVYITRLLQSSPADRAGLQPGDEVLQIGGKDVKAMGQAEVRSAFNGVPSSGLSLAVKHPDGTRLTITVKEGAIYPPFEEFGPIE